MKYLFLILFSISSYSMASTEQICKDTGRSVSSQKEVAQACAEMSAQTAASLQVVVKQTMADLRNRYEECLANNGNCSNYKIKVRKKTPNGIVSEYIPLDLTKLDEKEKELNNDVLKVAQLIFDKCQNSAYEKGYLSCKEELSKQQRILDDVLIVNTILSKVFPDTNGFRVDVGDILTGKPLGGDGAVLIELRESLITSIGISGDVAELIRNPITAQQNFIKDIARETANISNAICGDICKSLGVSF